MDPQDLIVKKRLNILVIITTLTLAATAAALLLLLLKPQQVQHMEEEEDPPPIIVGNGGSVTFTAQQKKDVNGNYIPNTEGYWERKNQDLVEYVPYIDFKPAKWIDVYVEGQEGCVDSKGNTYAAFPVEVKDIYITAEGNGSKEYPDLYVGGKGVLLTATDVQIDPVKKYIASVHPGVSVWKMQTVVFTPEMNPRREVTCTMKLDNTAKLTIQQHAK